MRFIDDDSEKVYALKRVIGPLRALENNGYGGYNNVIAANYLQVQGAACTVINERGKGSGMDMPEICQWCSKP